MEMNESDPSQLPTATWFFMENSTVEPDAGTAHLSLHSYKERVVAACFILVIALTNVIGNGTVILAVLFSKKLWTSTNAFVVSLCVADLSAGVAAHMSIIGLLSPGDSWPWSTEVPCSIAGLVLFINSSASLFNLVSIALNRLILIKYPMTLYRRLYTNRNMIVNLAALWIAAIAVMSVPPIFGIGGFGYDKQHHTCSDLDTHPKAKTFEKIQTFACFPVSLVVIITSYIMIFLHVRRHFMKKRANLGAGGNIDLESRISGPTNSTSEVSDNSAVLRSSQQDRINRQQIEITKNLFIAVCAFFVCITPYGIALFIPNNDRLLLYLAVLFFGNSAVNPIIYGAKHPQFKKVMRLILRCKYSEIEEPTGLLKALMFYFGGRGK